MRNELVGKVITAYTLINVESMQKIGFLNQNLKDFDQLFGKTIQKVFSRGNLIRLQLNGEINLLLGPEYGGDIIYHSKSPSPSVKFHLKLTFNDETCITVHIKSMGLIYVTLNSNLGQQYLYQRDFSEKMDPLSPEFTRDAFLHHLLKERKGLKSVLVGKDALIVGISNSAFQDILFRAKIYPNINVSALTPKQQENLYNAIQGLVSSRLNAHGKDAFRDFYGKSGEYIPLMGSNMKNKSCTRCGTNIVSMNLGGGAVFYCPTCQTPPPLSKKISKKTSPSISKRKS
jgi:formamidopyrimidine-DNA glycosylase